MNFRVEVPECLASFVCFLDRISNHVSGLKGYSLNKLPAQVQLQDQLCPIRHICQRVHCFSHLCVIPREISVLFLKPANQQVKLLFLATRLHVTAFAGFEPSLPRFLSSFRICINRISFFSASNNAALYMHSRSYIR